jgi:flagellar basal-body rod protein FlgB
MLGMNVSEIPVFTALREKMSFLAARQRVLSENVANASTPGFVPKDMDAKAFNEALAGQLEQDIGAKIWRTAGAHITPGLTRGLNGEFRAKADPDSDVTLDGNAVVLEDQMLKVSQTRGEYETAVALYQQGLSLLRMAVKVASR